MMNAGPEEWTQRLRRGAMRGWGAALRGEAQLCRLLIQQGLSAAAAKAALRAIELGALALLLYTVFWLAMFLGAVAFAVWVAIRLDLPAADEKLSWRDGPFGYGLYDQKGSRVDPGGPDELS